MRAARGCECPRARRCECAHAWPSECAHARGCGPPGIPRAALRAGIARRRPAPGPHYAALAAARERFSLGRRHTQMSNATCPCEHGALNGRARRRLPAAAAAGRRNLLTILRRRSRQPHSRARPSRRSTDPGRDGGAARPTSLPWHGNGGGYGHQAQTGGMLLVAAVTRPAAGRGAAGLGARRRGRGAAAQPAAGVRQRRHHRAVGCQRPGTTTGSATRSPPPASPRTRSAPGPVAAARRAARSPGRTWRPAHPDNVRRRRPDGGGDRHRLGARRGRRVRLREHHRHVHRRLRERQHHARPPSRSRTGSTPAPPRAPTCWPPPAAGTRAGPPRSACSTRPSR